MGESFGAWRMGNDAELLRHVSSANIACGFHAGDPSTIFRTVEIALENEVAVGAHPSFPDLQGFGRREMTISPKEVYEMILYQISAVKGVVESLGSKLHHVKPHGALYNQAARDKELANAIAKAVSDTGKDLFLYGLAGSYLISEAKEAGLKAASEVFADRTYQADGSLTPRSQSGALIRDVDIAAAQVLEMITENRVIAVNGEKVSLNADTVCIHGDGENAVAFAKEIRQKLIKHGVEIEKPLT